MKKKKTKKHRGCLTFLTFIILVGGLWWFNTYTVKTTEVTIESHKIKDDIKIVQLTDLHGSQFGPNNQVIISKIDRINPDFIVVTGDMYSSGDNKGRKIAEDLIRKLDEKYDVYAVNGEHDNDNNYLEALRDMGVDVLDYESRDIVIGDTRLCIYGIDNVFYTDTFDLANEFSLEREKYNILLAHIENFNAFAKFGMDLSICGDTHGGQLRLPYVGALINRGIWFPELEDGEGRYVKGLFEKEKTKLFVSSGLGNYPVPIRFMNRPEIAVINLTYGGKNER